MKILWILCFSSKFVLRIPSVLSSFLHAVWYALSSLFPRHFFFAASKRNLLRNAPCLTRAQKFQELNWTFLSVFSKRNIFLHFKTIFYSKLLSATNQQLFLRHWKRYRPSNHIAPLYELFVSILWLTLSFGEVSKTCRRMH